MTAAASDPPGRWRKSTHSGSMGDCVEVGQGGAVVAVRDSRDPDGPVLTFGGDAWTADMAGISPA